MIRLKDWAVAQHVTRGASYVWEMAAASAGSASEIAWLEPEPVFVHTKLLMILPLPDPLVVPACDLDRADARLAMPGFNGHVRVRSSTCVGAFRPERREL